MKVLPHTRDVIIRVLIFLGLFILISGITGSWIVRSPLLYGAGFWIYGNMGKMVLLLALFFPFLVRERLAHLTVPTWQKAQGVWLAVSFGIMPVFFSAGRTLMGQLPDFQPGTLILTHSLLLASPLLLIPGLFGIPFLRSFIRTFYRDIGICIVLAVLTYFGIFQAWKLWPIFSHGVLTAVNFLFSLTFPTVVVPPTTLIVREFGVRIEQACSGLDSLFMFSALYIFIGLTDWKTLNKPVWFALYIPAAIGLYIVNIVRVYLIVLIGVLWSPKLALELFHTYAGMVLFILYFLFFMKLFYPRMMPGKSPDTSKKTQKKRN